MKAAAGLSESRFVDINAVQKMFPDTEANDFAQHVAASGPGYTTDTNDLYRAIFVERDSRSSPDPLA